MNIYYKLWLLNSNHNTWYNKRIQGVCHSCSFLIQENSLWTPFHLMKLVCILLPIILLLALFCRRCSMVIRASYSNPFYIFLSVIRIPGTQLHWSKVKDIYEQP